MQFTLRCAVVRYGFRFHSTGRMLSTSAACRRRLTLGLWLRCGIPWGWGEKFILWRRPNCYRFPSIVILEYFLCSYLLQRFNRQSSGQALIAHLKRRLMEICSTSYPDFRNIVASMSHLCHDLVDNEELSESDSSSTSSTSSPFASSSSTNPLSNEGSSEGDSSVDDEDDLVVPGARRSRRTYRDVLLRLVLVRDTFCWRIYSWVKCSSNR